MRVININYHNSEFSYTEDYDHWKNIVSKHDDNIVFPDFLKKYKLKFMTAPTTSYYDSFILAKSKTCSLHEVESIINYYPNTLLVYTIIKEDIRKYKFRYGLIK